MRRFADHSLVYRDTTTPADHVILQNDINELQYRQ